MAHISDTENALYAEHARGLDETQLGHSHSPPSARQCSTEAVDTANEYGSHTSTMPEREEASLSESRNLSVLPDQAFGCLPNLDDSQHPDQPALADMAFQRLARGDAVLLEATIDAGADIEYESRDGLTLLVTAIKSSDIASTRLLLLKGANPQHRAQGKPPLFHAVQNQKHGPQLIRLLLDHGANVNTIGGPSNMNALHWAAAAGMVDATDYLLSKGMNIEATCAGAHTALHVAAGTGHLTVVQLLLAQGADLSKRGELGGNALTFASCRGYRDIVELCINEGLSVDDCNDDGLTALMSACELGHAHIVEYLLETGADVNRTDGRHSTPALEAAASGHIGILQALITAGSRLDVRNAKGSSIIEVAMTKGYANIVQLVLKTLGGSDYSLQSLALEIASARRLGTIRSLMISAASMHAQLAPNNGLPQKEAWVKWVLDSGGDLVKPRALSNMMFIAISDADSELVKALLQNGACLDLSSMASAIVNGHLELVQLLLGHESLSASPRHIACGDHDSLLLNALLNIQHSTGRSMAILKLLLDSKRFNILAGPSSNRTAFWRVLESDQWDPILRRKVAYMMLDSVTDVNYVCDGDGGTLMHHVVRFGLEDMVDFLISKGADVDARDREGQTPFILACGYQAKMIQLLLNRGANISLTCEDGKGPLHAAATIGNKEALEILLGLDCIAMDINQESSAGWTPLANALAADQEEAALLLIEHGADIKHVVHGNARSMLHLAAAFGHERVFEKIMAFGDVSIDARDSLKGATPLLLACAGTRYKLGSTQIVRALLATGADVETTNSDLVRPLHVAVSTYNTAIAKTLIEYGVVVTSPGSEGQTPLHVAAEYGNVDALRLLLQVGTIIEATDNSGSTPLLVCTTPPVAQILIDHGANIEHTDKNGHTALHHAVRDEDITMFQVLYKNGASVAGRTKCDSRNVLDMIEDLADATKREAFLMAMKVLS